MSMPIWSPPPPVPLPIGPPGPAGPMGPSATTLAPTLAPALAPARLPACGPDGGSGAVSLDLASAARACEDSRASVAAADPAAWEGSAADRFAGRREEDLGGIDRLRQAIEAARSALALHAVARQVLASALAGAGEPPLPAVPLGRTRPY